MSRSRVHWRDKVGPRLWRTATTLLLLTAGRASAQDTVAEPDLPQRIVGLDCPLPDVAPPHALLTVRCAIAPGPVVASVFLFYRTSPPSAREPFVSLEMRKTPMGWYVAEIPPSGLTDNAVRLFFEARDHDGLPVATNGNADASDIILVREGITVQDARQRRGGGCDNDILLYEIVPARAEWTWWTGAGAGARPAGGTMVANARLGGGISYGLGRLGAREVRGGPWISGETGFHGALGEGGLELLVASDREPTWDAIALRAGGGYGVDRGDRAPSISTTLTVGLRAVPARFHTRGPCEAVVPSERGHASVARLFLTTRDSFAGAGSVSIIAGVEIDPSLLLGSSRAQLHSARW